MSSCDYYSLYDHETGELTEWAETLDDHYETVVDQARQLDIRFERVSTEDVFDRLGIEREELPTGQASSLVRAEETRNSVGLPATCPHEAVDGSRCIFHMAPATRDEHDLTPADISREFRDRINTPESYDENRVACFAGARFRDLALPYETLAAESNRPVQLQFCQIDRLDLNDAVVDRRVDLYGSHIGAISCDGTMFRRPVSFSGAVFDCDTLSFSGSEFERGVTFSDATVRTSEIEFERCRFVGPAAFDEVTVEFDLSEVDEAHIPMQFTEARFESDFDFSGGTVEVVESTDQRTSVAVEFLQCEFEGEARFDECQFGADETDGSIWYQDEEPDESGPDIEWQVDLNESDFSEGVKLNDTELAGDLVLTDIDFGDGDSRFDDADIDGQVRMNGASFAQGDVDFSGATIHGEGRQSNSYVLNCADTSFGTGVLDMQGLEVGGDVSFSQLSFEGKRGDFSYVDIEGALNLEGTRFDVSGGEIIFQGVTVDGGLNVRQGGFLGNKIDFSSARFAQDDAADSGDDPVLDFRGTTWDGGEIDFSGADLGGDADFSLATFVGDEATFADMDVTGDFVMGDATLRTTHIDFSDWTVEDASRVELSSTHLYCNRASFDGIHIDCAERISFAGCHFEGEISFARAALLAPTIEFTRVQAGDATVTFQDVTTSGSRVQMRESTIDDGQFVIGDAGTIYDFESATIGDIAIRAEAEGDDAAVDDGTNLFEHFILKNTTFDGFDFSRSNVKQELKGSNWEIHTSRADEQVGSGLAGRTTRRLQKYRRLLRDGPRDSFDPNQLEVTYMKAKLGAKQKGDPDVISHFFQKELKFRRLSHGYAFWSRSDGSRSTWETVVSKAGYAKAWLSNFTLWLTVGYGERPSNVLLTSIFFVSVFALIYRAIDALPPGSSSVDYVTYSFQGFIQLVVGITPAGDILVRFFTAVEGFIGAFVIALFVITLTRSIDR